VLRERRDPVPLLALARCQAKTGWLVKARTRYRELAAVVLRKGAPAAAVKAVREGRAELEALSDRFARLRVEVRPDVSGVETSVDQVRLPTAAVLAGTVLDPGPHRVVVAAPGRVPTVVELLAQEGKTAEVYAPLPPFPW
jgi:hypothetical protein